jgi:hypothetical protein
MPAIDIVFRRALRRLRDALPGPTMASRLARQSGAWRNLPPHQRAAAYAQLLQTQKQLRQHHLQLKILPKLIDVLFLGLRSHLQAPLGQLILLCILAYLLSLWW